MVGLLIKNLHFLCKSKQNFKIYKLVKCLTFNRIHNIYGDSSRKIKIY